MQMSSHPLRAGPVMFFTLFLLVFCVKVACGTPREDFWLQPAGGDNLELGNQVEDNYKVELDKLGWLQPAQKKILSGLLHEVLESPEILQAGSPRPWRAESVDINHRRQRITLDTDLSTVDMTADGAFECPCISALPADVAALFAARGFPADYATKKCVAHDVNLANATAQAETGCVPGPNQPTFCKMEWCYVVDSCEVDESTCKAQGFQVGSFDAMACRARPRTKEEQYSWLKNSTPIYFSYQTCGNRDFYSNSSKSIQSAVAGRLFTAVIPSAPYAPWTYPPGYSPDAQFEKAHPEWREHGGILVKLVAAIAEKHDPPLVPKLLKGFASKRSTSSFPSSSFTACVMDVAVGNIDVCIGNFWLTLDRLSMGVNFVQPFGQDEFYILAPIQDDFLVDSFGEMLGRPWLPFSPELWVCFFAFIAFAAFVTFLTDTVFDLGDIYEPDGDRGDFQNPTMMGRYFRALQLNLMGYVGGGPQNQPTSVPGRLATIGFGWFLLILMSSYTANLASILVAKTGGGNSIKSIEDAITKKARICTLAPILPELKVEYPKGLFVTYVDAPAVVRELNNSPEIGKGDCDVGLLAIDQIKRSLSGEYNQDDCKKNATTCVRDASGKPNLQRDCDVFTVVGPTVLTVPLSFPVAPALFQSFAYTLQQMKADGQQAQIDKNERERLTTVTGSACVEQKSTDDTSALQLPLASMAGTFIIALFVQLFAIILSIAEYSSGRPVQDWFQAYDHITDTMMGDKHMKFGCPGYMRIVDSKDIAKVFAIFSPGYIVISCTQQLQYYKSEKDAHGKSLPKRTMSCKGMEIKAESTVTIPKSGRPVHYVLTVELPDVDMFGAGGSRQLECACESEEERETLKEMIVKMSEERDSSVLSQYDFQKEMKKRFGPLPNEKKDQDQQAAQNQQAAQVMQQQDVVKVSALMPQNLSAEYTVAPVFEQAPRASSAAMSEVIVPAPRMTMPSQNYTPSLAPSPPNYGRQEQDNWSLDVASSVFANRPGPPAKIVQQPPVSASTLQSRIVFEGYPS